MEQKVKAGDYVILTDPLNNGECVKVLEVHDGGYIMYGGGISSMYKPMKNEGLIHKAKVCATGEEVTVLFDPIEDCYKQVVTCDEEKNDAGRVFSFDELDFNIDEKTTAKEDTIAHPDYYNEGGIECFDVIRAALGTKGLVSFCEANIIKYAYRMKKKGKYLEDVRKIRDYADVILKIFNE